MKRTHYILYDARATQFIGRPTSEAQILVVCRSDEEARKFCGDFGEMACYSYEEGKNYTLINKRHEWDYVPGAGVVPV